MTVGHVLPKRWRPAVAGIAAVAALLAPGSGLAAPSPPSPADPTAVQGVTVEPPLSPEARFARALNFIQSHGAPARIGQLARWTDRVCPLTLGLTPSLNAFVSARVRLLAARVGAPLHRFGRCRPPV